MTAFFAKYKRIDWIMLVCMLMLAVTGVRFIQSAGGARASVALQELWTVHAWTAAAGLLAYLALASIDYRKLLKWCAIPFFGVSIAMLVAVLLFGERLNLLQSLGVGIAILAYFLMRISGKKEGIDFHSNRWIWCLIVAVLLGSASGLYDKFLMSPESGLGMDNLQVLSWYTLYQLVFMSVILALVWMPNRQKADPFQFRWSIPFISLFLCAADFAYLQALAQPGALISVISMIRRGSVLVSFVIGAFFLKEQNIKAKAWDLALVFVSMILLYLGSK